jgi:hypothetical protein
MHALFIIHYFCYLISGGTSREKHKIHCCSGFATEKKFMHRYKERICSHIKMKNTMRPKATYDREYKAEEIFGLASIKK